MWKEKKGNRNINLIQFDGVFARRFHAVCKTWTLLVWAQVIAWEVVPRWSEDMANTCKHIACASLSGSCQGFLSLKCSCSCAVNSLGSLQDSCISTLTTAQKSLRQGSLLPCRVLEKRPQCLSWTLRFCWWKGFPLLCALRPEGASGSIGMNHTNVSNKRMMSCPSSRIGFP